jgi:hypothetical protein
MKYLNVALTIGFATWGIGCASDPGTKPHDASVAQHEAMAQQEEAAAAGHADQHDPDAKAATETCAGKGGCWTAVSNPTDQHRDDAKRHAELAQKHRAAGKTLTDAEARACEGISEHDRDMSPFYHREDIQSVAPLTEAVKAGKGTTQKEVGATVVFKALPGMTAEWLQRVVDCHVARASAVGHEMHEMSYCPLVLKGVKAKVSSAGNGFAIDVSSDDPATAAEIKRRAQALMGAAASPS